MSIDPGNDHTGVAIFTLTFPTFDIIAIDAITSNYNERDAKFRFGFGEGNGARYAKVRYHGVKLHKLIKHHNPAVIICEAPFFNPKMPGVYKALVELLTGIRNACYKANHRTPFLTYEPRTVKANLGSKMKGKEAVYAALKAIEELNSKIAIDTLSEHAIDAIAVGFKHITVMRDLFKDRRV